MTTHCVRHGSYGRNLDFTIFRQIINWTLDPNNIMHMCTLKIENSIVNLKSHSYKNADYVCRDILNTLDKSTASDTTVRLYHGHIRYSVTRCIPCKFTTCISGAPPANQNGLYKLQRAVE